MKTCPNCRVIHDDDYNGTCQECGAPLGNVKGSNSGNLQFAFAKQVQAGQREAGQEQALKAGRIDGVSLPTGLIDVAKSFINTEKLEEAIKDAGG